MFVKKFMRNHRKFNNVHEDTLKSIYISLKNGYTGESSDDWDPCERDEILL